MRVKFETQGITHNYWDLNPKQQRFLASQARYVCYSGGMGCGKSLALVLKIIHLMLKYENNYGLVGRLNFSDLRDTTMKDFFDICPPEYIKAHNKQEKKVTFHNGSSVIFRGLKEVKKTEIRSLNLGFFCLEQAEEIGEELFNELSARLRRKIVDYDKNPGKQQGFIICNPSISWIFKYFKQKPINDIELIEGSMLDNAEHLPGWYLKDMMSKPESWQRQFVYGIWDESVLADRAVFASEHIAEQSKNIKEPIRNFEDMQIFKDFEQGHEYQMGIDPSEGAEDFCAIKVVDKMTGEEVAMFSKRMQPDLLAYKVEKLGNYYGGAKAVLEINGIGLATLTKLKELAYEDIYIREEFDKHAKVMTKKLGWRTTHASKPLLIGKFQELLQNKFVKLRDTETLEEMKTFVYSSEVHTRGMGAERGFHDDSIIATMLAYVGLYGEGAEATTSLIIHSTENRYTGDEVKERLHLEEILNEPKTKSWLEL